MGFLFQSTLPAWGATYRFDVFHVARRISIHAPRVGSDARPDRQPPRFSDFNPRSPRGERRGREALCDANLGFQSTLPAWGATSPQASNKEELYISIHAPRVGSDSKHSIVNRKIIISIHAPRVGSD